MLTIKPNISAQKVFDEISNIWNFSEAVSIKTINEFMKIEKIKKMFQCNIEHI